MWFTCITITLNKTTQRFMKKDISIWAKQDLQFSVRFPMWYLYHRSLPSFLMNIWNFKESCLSMNKNISWSTFFKFSWINLINIVYCLAFVWISNYFHFNYTFHINSLDRLNELTQVHYIDCTVKNEITLDFSLI